MSTGASLIQAEAARALAAPPLSFFEEVEEAEKRLADAGDFTGERLFRDRPGVYAAVVRMCAEGMSISATARALGVSRNTVCAVRDREGFSIEQDKKELLRDLRRAGRLSVEKVIELLPDVKSAKDAAITAAVMIDKQQLLSGEATARVERVDVKPDQVKAYLDSLPVVDGEVLEVISTGVPAGMAGQKGGPAAGWPEPESDQRSDDAVDVDSDGGQAGTTCRTTAGAAAAVVGALAAGA
jgi:transposase-like protein